MEELKLAYGTTLSPDGSFSVARIANAPLADFMLGGKPTTLETFLYDMARYVTGHASHAIYVHADNSPYTRDDVLYISRYMDARPELRTQPYTEGFFDAILAQRDRQGALENAAIAEIGGDLQTRGVLLNQSESVTHQLPGQPATRALA